MSLDNKALIAFKNLAQKKQDSIFALAGLWETWSNGNEELEYPQRLGSGTARTRG